MQGTEENIKIAREFRRKTRKSRRATRKFIEEQEDYHGVRTPITNTFHSIVFGKTEGLSKKITFSNSLKSFIPKII